MIGKIILIIVMGGSGVTSQQVPMASLQGCESEASRINYSPIVMVEKGRGFENDTKYARHAFCVVQK